ncbi:28S ribosomal protein S31, mitochondrial [Papilio xuthus]|uniref:Small ribosomal subunit protein mS31 n=1 Tax=Papilio xuthus TaxID=66420 RepID=A0A194PQ63_PAPXU|nr:28S ribosomal protein S31, mitochondrial [Papilio xuthus]
MPSKTLSGIDRTTSHESDQYHPDIKLDKNHKIRQIVLEQLKFKRDFRLIVRCLSEKPPEKDGKVPNVEDKNDKVQNKSNSENPTEKIQALLKSIMAAPKISEKKLTVAPERKQKPKVDDTERNTQKIEENLTKAAEEVAQAIGGDVKHTEAELLSKVLGMKVDRMKESDEGFKTETRGQQVKRLVERARTEAPKTRFAQRKEFVKKSLPQATSVNIFGGEPLGIFKAKEENYGTKLDMWDRLNQRELDLATLQPPANYFQKMIQWTEQGKVWKFPINNEQGLEEENNVHFSEHIFLDVHLEGWCPTRGPIRHFMELVCVGLSKNPFYTAQEKKDHIMWYKEYFESKKDVLLEVGAWDVKPNDKEANA